MIADDSKGLDRIYQITSHEFFRASRRRSTMRRESIMALSIATVLIFTGCQRRHTARENGQAKSRIAGMAGGGGGAMPLDLDVVHLAYASERYIAETHSFSLVSPESQLQQSWDATLSYCRTIRCEVLSSRITVRTGDIAPSGEMSLRVVPDDFPKLLARLAQLASIAEHSTARQDKTDDVIDADAQLKNLTAFRDNLRAMLAKPSAKVSDLVEIQKQLSETQATLDAAALARKALANETEKISVEITYRVAEPNMRNPTGLAQIARSLSQSGVILADSIANVIETVVFLLPWLILAIPVIWLVAKFWRRRKLRRATQ